MKKSLFVLITALAATPAFLIPAEAAKPVALTKDTFDVKTAKGVVLVDFWAEWCGPCKLIAPIVEELANDYKGKAVIAKIDVDANRDLAARFKIRSIPALMIFKDGKVVDEIVGYRPKEDIVKVLEKHLK